MTARPSRLLPLALLLAAAAAPPGCVIDRTGRSGTSMMYRDIEANTAAVEFTREEIDAERKRLDAIENRAALARRSLAESTATAENLLESVQEVAGQVQALRHTLDKGARFDNDVDARIADLEFRLMAIEDHLGIEVDYGDDEDGERSGENASENESENESETENENESETEDERSGDPGENEDGLPTAAAPAPTPAAPGDDASAAATAEDGDDPALDLLGRALQAAQEEKYRQAGSTLNEFLRTYPDHPRVGDARNLLGDCLYAMGRYKEAISEYEEFIRVAPDHPSVPRAMYRQGMAFVELGTDSDLDAARVFLDDLIEKYPDSPEAERARRKIEILE